MCFITCCPLVLIRPPHFSTGQSSSLLWSPDRFLITCLGMLALFCGCCHGDRQVPLVGYFTHNFQMLCQMQVVHTLSFRQGRAQRWDPCLADFHKCVLQLDKKQMLMPYMISWCIVSWAVIYIMFHQILCTCHGAGRRTQIQIGGRGSGW